MSYTFPANPTPGQPGSGGQNWGQILNTCLDSIKSKINLNKAAFEGHNHDDKYSEITHIHPDYSPTTHSHDAKNIAVSPSIGGKNNVYDLLADFIIRRAANVLQTGIHFNVPSGASTKLINAADILSELNIVSPVDSSYIIGINYHFNFLLETIDKSTSELTPVSATYVRRYQESSSIKHFKDIVFSSLAEGDYVVTFSVRLIRIDQVSVLDQNTTDFT